MRKWLSDLRGEKSQREIAVKCGISQQAYSKFELGVISPAPKTAKLIGKVLGFDWTKFYDEPQAI